MNAIARTIAVGLAASTLLCAGMAAAQSPPCSSYPNPLTDGTTAYGSQVMANFNCAALLGGANFTGPIVMGTSVSYPAITIDNTGAAGIGFQHASGAEGFVYDDGNMHVEGNANLWLNSTSNGNVFLAAGGGAVGIGTSSPNASLTVVSPGNTAAAYVSILPQNLTASVNIGYNHLWEAGSNGNNALYVDSEGSGAVLLQAYGGTGNVGIGTGTPSAKLYVNGTAGGTSAWTVSSDARLKTNVAPVTGALAAVLQLQGVTYSFIAPQNRTVGQDLDLPDTPQVGFVAQDVAKVVPQAVVPPADPATGVYSLMESKLIPFLVEAIKTQQAQIATLQAQAAALQATH